MSVIKMSVVFLAFFSILAVAENGAAAADTKDETVEHLVKIEEALAGYEAIHVRHQLRNDPGKHVSDVLKVFRTLPVAKPADDKDVVKTAEYLKDQKQREDALEMLKSVKAKDLVGFKGALVEIQKQYQNTKVGEKANELVLSATLAESGVTGDIAVPSIEGIPTFEETKAMKEALAGVRANRGVCPTPAKLAGWTKQLGDERAVLEKALSEKLVETRRLERAIPRLEGEVKGLQQKQRLAVAKLDQISHEQNKLSDSIVPMLKDIFVMKPYVVTGVDKGIRTFQNPAKEFSDDEAKKVTDHFYKALASRILDGTIKERLPKGVASFDALTTLRDGAQQPLLFNKIETEEENYAEVKGEGFESLAALYENMAETKAHDTASITKVATGRLKDIDKVVELVEKSGLAQMHRDKVEVEKQLAAKMEELKKEQIARDVIAKTIEKPLAEIDRVFGLVESCSDSVEARDKFLKSIPHAAPTAEAMKQAAEKAKDAKDHGSKAIDAIKERNKK